MHGKILRALSLAVALAALAFASPGWADRGHGDFHHYPYRHFHGGTSFFIGGTFWPFPPPYGYGPVYVVPYRPPQKVYVERFDGTPTPQTQGEIFCPNEGAYYPDVKQCPGGWQRVIRPADGG